MNYIKLFGSNVRFLRKKLAITQEQLAEMCNLHRTYIVAIERGDRNVSLNNIVKISTALNVTPSYLLSDIRKEDKK